MKHDTVPATDVMLMLRVRQGEESAFEQLHGRYQRKLLNFFYSLCRNPQAANDLCQETFLRIWKIRLRYRALGSFPGYLFGIARLVWLEHCRDLRKNPSSRIDYSDLHQEPATEDRHHPDYRAQRAEVQQHLFAALEELPEEQRMVFVMRNIEGLSLRDIAEALDCPVNTVRSRKILAVKKLRHLLSDFFTHNFETTLQEYRS